MLPPKTAAAHRAQPGFESAFVMNVDGEDGQQRHMGYVQFSSAEAAAAARKVSAAREAGCACSSNGSNSISNDGSVALQSFGQTCQVAGSTHARCRAVLCCCASSTAVSLALPPPPPHTQALDGSELREKRISVRSQSPGSSSSTEEAQEEEQSSYAGNEWLASLQVNICHVRMPSTCQAQVSGFFKDPCCEEPL